MAGSKERNCQIRMSSSLWNLVGEIAQGLGYQDARGRHSAIIREMIAASAAKWAHSPYVCRSSHHTVFVSKDGDVHYRLVQLLRLNSEREKLPCFIEMKPEKREYYRKQRELHRPDIDGHDWFKRQWLLNYFAVWNGKKDAGQVDEFRQLPLSSATDIDGASSKNADLPVHGVSGRFLTREIAVILRDYVQWKEPGTTNFDRIDIPIDIPTTDLEVCVVVDQDLFRHTEEDDEIANLSLEFRNRESARFEGKEVALYPEIRFDEQYGRSSDFEGADEMLRKTRLMRQRIRDILDSRTSAGQLVGEIADKDSISSSLIIPQRFLFYRLQWPSPHLGIEVCVRWEKPVR